MKEQALREFLMASIFIVVVVILLTPFFNKKQSTVENPSFTHTPILRINYLENRTVFDIQSQIGDYYFRNMTASVSQSDANGTKRDVQKAENAYVLSGETNSSRFNLTISISDLAGAKYVYMGDFNITKMVLDNKFHVFFNITEHWQNWLNKKVSLVPADMPYRTPLGAVPKEAVV